MKWFLILLLVLISIVLAGIGLLACADPEGRGAVVATRLFVGAFLMWVAAFGVLVRW